MNTEVLITYNTSRKPRARDAYRVSFSESDTAPYELRQIGPVANNIVYYRGVYVERLEAEEAAREYFQS